MFFKTMLVSDVRDVVCDVAEDYSLEDFGYGREK